MERVSVFVDAGYLFAQGSKAIKGSSVKREFLSLNLDKVISEVICKAEELSRGAPLLRIYWYDAVGPHGLTLEQGQLSSTDNVKMRLGTLNGRGQQKGVDSMIVIDMIELARNHAISDAVLIAGDEDVRVGVQFAQNYGVRVHLIGIEAVNSESQSQALIHESDTHTKWQAEIIETFLSVRQNIDGSAESETNSKGSESADDKKPQKVSRKPTSSQDKTKSASVEGVGDEADQSATSEADFERLTLSIEKLISSLLNNDVKSLKDLFTRSKSIPREFDSKLLVGLRDDTGRLLSVSEKGFARRKFMELIKLSERDEAK